MPFSAEVRTSALVAAARHCCICRRYKGVKVEVHHIVPQAEGGSDDLKNAIPLCFDCHADAGHYNPRHPRGTKFSREELHRARDEWYVLVQRNEIASPVGPDLLYCRYLVCKDFGALLEIGRCDVSRFPVPSALLIENDPLEFLRSALRSHRETYRHAREWGDRYSTEEEYFSTHPDAVRTDRGDTALPYFQTVRAPTLTELRQRVATGDGITRLLLESGASPEEIARVVGFFEPCGANGFQEMYRLRPLWGAFLAVTNIASEPVRLAAITGLVERPMTLAFRSLEERVSSDDTEVSLPRAPIPAGATVMIPVATVLAPLEYVSGEEGASSEQELEFTHWQSFVHTKYPQKSIKEFRLIGPSVRPRGLWLEAGGDRRFQEVHELDLTNLYVLDRGWSVGSCPHLFLKDKAEGKLHYRMELFSGRPGQPIVETVEIPNGTSELVIAELEREVTYIESIRIGSQTAFESMTLVQNDVVRLRVSERETITIVGWYEPNAQVRDDVWQRNELIARFLTLEAS